ncbi:MAG: hypothetical protein QM770_25345 [Tepidisphaeraceae bacterium]
MSSRARAVIVVLAEYVNVQTRRGSGDWIAWPSLTTLQRHVGLARGNITRAMNDLEALGIIERRRQGGLKSTLYRLLPPGKWAKLPDASRPIEADDDMDAVYESAPSKGGNTDDSTPDGDGLAADVDELNDGASAKPIDTDDAEPAAPPLHRPRLTSAAERLPTRKKSHPAHRFPVDESTTRMDRQAIPSEPAPTRSTDSDDAGSPSLARHGVAQAQLVSPAQPGAQARLHSAHSAARAARCAPQQSVKTRPIHQQIDTRPMCSIDGTSMLLRKDRKQSSNANGPVALSRRSSERAIGTDQDDGSEERSIDRDSPKLALHEAGVREPVLSRLISAFDSEELMLRLEDWRTRNAAGQKRGVAWLVASIQKRYDLDERTLARRERQQAEQHRRQQLQREKQREATEQQRQADIERQAESRFATMDESALTTLRDRVLAEYGPICVGLESADVRTHPRLRRLALGLIARSMDA